MIVLEPASTATTTPAILQCVRLRARRRAIWMRHLWSQEMTAPDQGLAIASGEVSRILAGPEELATAEAAFYEAHEEARRLASDIADAERWVAEDLRWLKLCQTFGLSTYERDLLALAVAAEFDPPLRRVYAYLHDDAAAVQATPWLAAALFGWPAGTIVGPGPLERWRIARPAGSAANPWGPMTGWNADPDMVMWLATGQGQASAAPDQLCIYPKELEAMQDFANSLPGEQVEIELVGPPGSGRRTLAGQFAASSGKRLVTVRASELTAEGAIRAARMARLEDAIVYCEADASLPPLREFARLLIVGRLAPDPMMGIVRRSIDLPPLTRAMRLELWSALADAPVPEPVAEWSLTPAEIAASAKAAAAGPAAASHACRRQLAPQFEELLTPLPCPYTWEDFVAAQPIRQHLAEFEQQARLRTGVYEEWGFERLVPLGRGITALFAGPSGTGKTMAAQVLAQSLGVPLYRVDLAGVVNKYIGETEKRLKQVFDFCERAYVMVLFDEADALFGQRMQVKDAHDRFANIEIDYLLQRMERFDGIAVLATNRKSDLDSGFLRRLRFIVDFLPPGPEQRKELWRRALEPKTPSGETVVDELNWDVLAERLPMTGADIKMAALSAAFLARAESSRIGMRHVLAASRRELTKRGVVPRAGL